MNEILIFLCGIEGILITILLVLVVYVWPRKPKPLVVPARDGNGRRIQERISKR